MRSVFEDAYPAKFDPAIAKMLIELYSSENQLVLDCFSGSGTIPIEAVKLNRHAVAIDINPQAIGLIRAKYAEVEKKYKVHGKIDIVNLDAKKALAQLDDNSVDFTLTSPTFGISIDAAHESYSDIADDMGNSSSYEEWRNRIKPVLKELHRITRPNHLVIIEIRPRAYKNRSYPLWHWITTDALEAGFDYFCEFIEQPVPPFMFYTSGKPDARMPMPWHSFLLAFIKPENHRLF